MARSSWYRRWPLGPSFDELLDWLSGARAQRRKRRTFQLNVEELEDRRVPSLVPAGNEFLVNQTTAGTELTQSARTVAAAPDGRSVVVWQGPQGSSTGTFARLYQGDGTALTGEFLVNQYTTGKDFYAGVAMDATGDFVVTWSSQGQDGGGYGVYARRYSAAGVALGDEFQVNQYTTGDQWYSTVAMDAAGDFIVSWTSDGPGGSGYDVYARRYSAAGRALGTEFMVNQYTTNLQVSPSVAMDAAGDFVIAWQSYLQDTSGFGVYARQYNAAGQALAGEFQVNQFTHLDQDSPSVAIDAAGDFVITWQSYGQDGNFTGLGIFARRYSASGQAVTDEFQVNQYTTDIQDSPSVAMDAQGDFVVSWQSRGQDGSGFGVFARRYSPAGLALSAEFPVNQFTTGNQQNVSVALDADGDAVFAWSSYGQDGNSTGFGVYARRYTDTDTGADTAGPMVGDVYAGTSSLGSDQAIAPGQRLVADVPQLAVTFTEALNTASATSAANWALTRDSVDVSGQISGIGYAFDATSNKYVVTLSLTAPLSDGAYTLTARAAITDTGGNRLDGDRDASNTGEDFTLAFTIARVVPAGNEFLVNVTTAQSQTTSTSGHSVAAAPDGRSIVTWTSPDADGYGVYARVYKAEGTPLTGEFLVNQYTTQDQRDSSVAMDAQGDFVVTWNSSGQDGDRYGVYARRYNAAGTALGNEFHVNQYTTGNQQHPSVAMDAQGDFVVSWESYGQDGNAHGFGVYARHYNAAGTAQGNEFPVNQYTIGNQKASSVAMDAADDFVVSWESQGQDGSGFGVYARVYSAAGTALGNEFPVNQYTTSDQSLPSVAMDAVGDFVVSWQSRGQDGDGYGVYARIYNAAGTALGNEFPVNQYTTGNQQYPSVALDAEGDFVVTWTSFAQDGDGYGVYARRYSAAGLAQGNEFPVNQYTTSDQFSPNAAMDAAGDFILAWTSFDQDGSGDGVYARRYGTSADVTSAASTTFTVGTPGTFTVTATGTPTPTLSAAGDTLPSGVTFNGTTGVLAGTPAAGIGTYHLVFTAHNGIGNDATQNFTLTVNQAPAITSAVGTTFTVGVAGMFTVTATGTPAPTLSESGDTLPSGITFNAATGVLAGDAGGGLETDGSGRFHLVFTAHNGIGNDATQNFTLTVNHAAAVTSAASTGFTAGTAGTFTVTATGSPTPTLSESGDTLLGGVTFTAATGVLAGTPAAGAGGTYHLVFTAHNGIGNDATQNFTLVVFPPGFAYDPATKTMTMTGANFTFAEATTADAAGTHTTFSFTIDGTTQTAPDTIVSHAIVNGQGASATAILITNDTYVDTQGATQETKESIALGSRADAGVGTLQKFDPNGNPFTFLTLSHFPISYAYAGRNDGAVQLYGTAGVPYNGFVSAGNYSYIGGPGLFHLAQGAPFVYGYGAGQASDFAYHYAANAGSAYVVSGTAFSYMSAMDTVGGVTESFFNVGVGFLQNTGVAKNPGKDFAYVIDSPGNDTFVGGDANSFMFIAGPPSPFAEFDAVYGFALVFAQSFVGGTDAATNSDPNRNILNSRWMLVG